MPADITWTNPLKKILLLWLCLLSVNPVFAGESEQPELVHILSQENYNPKEFSLPDADWRWLRTRHELNVAVWQPEIPPLAIFSGEGRFEGMIADYIFLLSQYLGIKIQVQMFSDRESAMAALHQHQVDMVADPSGKHFPQPHEVTLSRNFISDHPVLVHRKKKNAAPFHYQQGMRLAIAGWYVDDSWIEANFPGVSIKHYQTDDQAMASVAFDENDFYIGNLMTTSYLLERNYSHYLTFRQVYPERDTGSHFVMRQGDQVLIRAVDRVLTSLSRPQKQVILQQWSDRANLWRVSKPVSFSESEKRWLAKHPTVDVSVNAFYAPFTMIDAGGNFYGVTADILRLIRLRTGIQFRPVSADSVGEMDRQIARGETLFIGALSHSDDRNENLLFSRPYFNSPFVFIERSDSTLTTPFPPGTRVAVVSKNGLLPELVARNPGIRIIETDNASLAMQKVDNGEADVAIHTLFGASYMIERYFRDRLKTGGRVGSQQGDIAFAIARNQPELQSILNKSLENISPADINSVIDKWQTRPDVRLDTWELYKTQFWLVFSVAGLILLTSVMWIYYLRREVCARRLAQQGLQSQLEQNEALTFALSEARERAEQANRAKSTFLATMSHEIRTPVSAIIGLLELSVNTRASTPDEDDPVRVAWESARTLMGLIGDILDMARIESGRLELMPEWVRSTDLLPPIVRVFEGLARQKSLHLRCSVPPQLPYQLFIDPLRFRQVLSNLVSNAIKFTEQGGVNVEMVMETEAASDRAQLRICVMDSGKGISPEEQKDIFDPWVQTRNGATQTGSGLGLAICAQLVQMMSGDISMTSQPGQGTRVSFTIPVRHSQQRPEQQQQNVELADKSPHQPLHILAVDDHPANRMLLRRQLTHLGHRVTEARDGEDAWAQWQKGRFDVVITDCSMPGMDGLALTRHIREHETTPGMILGLTANAWPEERTRCLNAGMNDCLFKPLQLPQLEKLLNNVMKQLPAVAEQGPGLKALIDYPKLLSLSHHDEQMLKELLLLTRQTNDDDLRRGEDLLELQDWPELSHCLHRISGAAQICGAERTRRACRQMESACLQPQVDAESMMSLWQAVSDSVTELNHAIEGWLKQNKR